MLLITILILNPLQCFPSAIASHVVSEYPNKCLVSAKQYCSCCSTYTSYYHKKD